MTAAPPDTASPAAQPGPAAPRRKGPPTWGIVLFLALLGGWMAYNQWASESGPPIQWIDNDLPAALRQVSDARPRVFLYLYDPNDPIHQRNEREVFRKKWARDPLQFAVCCRVAVRRGDRGDRLAREYNYRDTPLFLLLGRSGTPMSRAEGGLTELEFYTSIGKPLWDLHQRAAQHEPATQPGRDAGPPAAPAAPPAGG